MSTNVDAITSVSVVALTIKGVPITIVASKSARISVSTVARICCRLPIVIPVSKSTSVIESVVAEMICGPPPELTKNAVDRILIA